MYYPLMLPSTLRALFKDLMKKRGLNITVQRINFQGLNFYIPC